MKPKVICHIMGSVDGKVLVERWSQPFDNGGMLQQEMIDELSYVIYPGIDGTSDSVSIFHYMGNTGESPMANQSLELLSAEKKEYGVVWLRYKIHQ